MLLAAAVVGTANAQTTPPATTTPSTSTPQMVVQLAGILTDPTTCTSQLTSTDPVNATHLGYSMKEFTNLNYPIAAGDYLEYEVLVPAAGTLHGGAVDGDTDMQPRAAAGPTIRDSYVTEDQNGLFAHP